MFVNRCRLTSRGCAGTSAVNIVNSSDVNTQNIVRGWGKQFLMGSGGHWDVFHVAYHSVLVMLKGWKLNRPGRKMGTSLLV